ncbi:MAG: hypothetical protein QNL04_07785 [SAR324 cluster bacterium]|nr:hypothetical protein [SAR324 cluster bacterium]
METFTRMPIGKVAADVQTATIKSQKVITSKRISDHWKEKVILVYAKVIFVATLKLILLLGLIGAIVGATIYLSLVINSPIDDFLSSWEGLAFSTFASSLYFFVRKFFV